MVQDVTLQDLDAANARPEGGNDLVSFMSQTLKTKKTEMTERLRKEVNEVFHFYNKQQNDDLKKSENRKNFQKSERWWPGT